MRIALFAAVIVVALVPAVAASGASTTRICREHFVHVPGIRVKVISYRVTGTLHGHPTSAAETCARGKTVIQDGFMRFGGKLLDYHEVGRLHLTVHGTTYAFVLPTPMASGSYAWSGGSTLIEYSLPTGP